MHENLLPVLKIEDITTPVFSELAVLRQQFDGKNRLDEAHKHDFYLIFFVDKGKGKHFIDFESYDVTDNTIFFLAPGQAHYWHLDEETTGYQLLFSTSLLTELGPMNQWPFFIPKNPVKIHPTPDQFAKIINELDQITEESTASLLFQKKILSLRLELILTLLARWYHEQYQRSASGSAHLTLTNFQLLLETHYKTEPGVDFYAEKLHISANYLNTVCKKQIDQTAGAVIRERRILEAKRLLTMTQLDTQEIGYQLGFGEVSYFSHFFRKHTGIAPTVFRKKNQMRQIDPS